MAVTYATLFARLGKLFQMAKTIRAQMVVLRTEYSDIINQYSEADMYMVGHLTEQIENRMFDALDERLVDQLRTQFWDTDKQRPDHPKGSHDDLLISLALALWCCKDIPLSILHNLRANIIDQAKRRMRAKKARRAIPWRTSVPRNRSPY